MIPPFTLYFIWGITHDLYPMLCIGCHKSNSIRVGGNRGIMLRMSKVIPLWGYRTKSGYGGRVTTCITLTFYPHTPPLWGNLLPLIPIYAGHLYALTPISMLCYPTTRMLCYSYHHDITSGGKRWYMRMQGTRMRGYASHAGSGIPACIAYPYAIHAGRGVT